MSDAPVYVIKTLNDLLQVPSDRRRAMFDAIEQGLLLYEFAWGDDTPDGHEPMVFTWTDDGCHDTTLHTPDGETVLQLKVKTEPTGKPAAHQAGTTENPLSTDRPSPYVSAEETAALLAAGGATDVIHKQHFGALTLETRHTNLPGDIPTGTQYMASHLDEPNGFYVHFHSGNPAEVGINGWTNEAMLAALIHRTQILDAQFASPWNKQAIHHMQEAAAAFGHRTAERQARGVAGKQEA